MGRVVVYRLEVEALEGSDGSTVRVEHDTTEVGDEREPGVGPSALIVKSILSQHLELDPILLIRHLLDPPLSLDDLADGGGDLELLLQVLNCVDKQDHLLVLSGASKSKGIRKGCIVSLGVRGLVLRKEERERGRQSQEQDQSRLLKDHSAHLWEGRLLEGLVGGVVADDVRDESTVGKPMRDVILCTQLMSHGVTDAKEGVAKRHAGNGALWTFSRATTSLGFW